MAEVRDDQEEQPLPVKRKPDSALVQDDESSKKPKFENSVPSSIADDKNVGKGSQKNSCSVIDEEDEDDEDDYNVEEEEEEDEDEAEIDRKGKVITSDDKGKGKMIEESSVDSDSDSDSSAFGSDIESDLSDDPLAEVDLDNILPSRTRRHSVHSGVCISQAAAGKAKYDSDGDHSNA